MSNEKHPMRNPIQALFHAALLLLGTAIVLTLALQLLAAIWIWLVVIAALVGGAFVAIRLAIARRNRW